MTLAQSKIDPTKDLLRLMIDDGTGMLKVSGQWIPANSRSRNSEPFVIRLMGMPEVVQKVVLENDLGTGHLIWGDHDVNRWIRQNPRQADRVCQLWKLVLSEDYRNTPTGRAVFKAIGAEHGNMESYEEFVTLHFKRIRSEIIERLINNHSSLSVPDEGVDIREHWMNMVQTETSLMVPAKWSQDARSIMVAAATAAGFTNVGIVIESQVAVASLLPPLFRSKRVVEGDHIVVLDVGRGTVDISTATIEPATRLVKLVGTHPTCDLAGSQLVNEGICNYVETCPEVVRQGGFDEVCRRLNHSDEEFRMLVSDAVEDLKPRFPDTLDFLIAIPGRVSRKHIRDRLNAIYIMIPWETMRDCFDQQVKEILKLLDKHLHQHEHETDVHGAIATGGGAKNRYVREEIDKYFLERIGTGCFDLPEGFPACLGGLTHYPENYAQQLPEGVLYICRDEEWTKTQHPEATVENGIVQQALVKKGKNKKGERESWVRDRLTPIMSKGGGELRIGQRVVMIFNVPASTPGRIKFPLFHSTNACKKHHPAYDKDLNVQPDLVKWTVRFTNMTGDFSRRKFPSMQVDGKLLHEVTTIVKVEGDETHLDLVLQVLKPGDLQYNDLGKERVDIDYESLLERRVEIWDRYRSPFPMKDEAIPQASLHPSPRHGRLKPSTELQPPLSPMPFRPRSQAAPSTAHQGPSNTRSPSKDQLRADSGVAVSGDKNDSNRSDPEDDDLQPPETTTASSYGLRKRKRTSQAAPSDLLREPANDHDEDELWLPWSLRKKTRSRQSKATSSNRPPSTSPLSSVPSSIAPSSQRKKGKQAMRPHRQLFGNDDEDDDEEPIHTSRRRSVR